MNKNDAVSVSVVISVYNGEAYIKRCIESVLLQTRGIQEIIVYNDASTDGTKKIVEEIMEKEPGIRFFNSKTNRGPGGGKNYAVKYVITDYFMFLDADDYLDYDYVEKLMSVLPGKKYPLPDIVFSGFKSVDFCGNLRYIRTFRDAKNALYEGVSNWGKLFRKVFWEECHLEIPSGKVMEDVLLRACIVGNEPEIVYVPEADGYNYVWNPSSVSNTYMNGFVSGVAELELRYLAENYEKILPDRKEEYLYWVYKIFCWHLLKSGAGVGISAMRKEHRFMKQKLRELFPHYKTCAYLRFKKLPQERKIVKTAIRTMYWLDVVHLQSAFLILYSYVNLRRLWPNL